MEKISYALGMLFGSQLKDMGLKDIADAGDMTRAITDVLGEKTTAMTMADAQRVVQSYMQQVQEAAGRKAREAGEKFLADNAKKEGVSVTESGLQYMVLTPALGQKPVATDTVRCHYEGRLTDGTVFDSSYRRGEPATFGLQQVIKGWTEGLQLMAVGSKFRFFIPYNLAYGAQGAGGSIPPYAALVFDVELLGIE